MITVDLIHSFFEYFYKKRYVIKDKKFKIYKTSITIKHSETFIKILNDQYGNTVGKEFLYRYFLFQFNYWDQVEFKGNSAYATLIQPSFIIGKKAFKRFLDRNIEFDWLLENLPFVDKYNVKKSDLIEQLLTKRKIAVNKGSITDTEAPIKLAAYNTPAGFINCIDFSTLYNEKSSICKDCVFKEECMKTLKKLYPSIYVYRGYKL